MGDKEIEQLEENINNEIEQMEEDSDGEDIAAKENDEQVEVKNESDMPVAVKLEVKNENHELHPTMANVKVRKLPQKYNNLYGFDPLNRVWICAACGVNFYSDHGMRNHLNVTCCGFGDKEDYKPKIDYTSLYMKERGQLICCGCGTVYHSEHGMYYHLKETKCGYGDKEKPTPKKDFTPFYKVENCIYICLVCGVNYDSIRGMHYHLNKKCGADAKLKMFQPKSPAGEGQKKNKSLSGEKKNYKQFYRKEDNSTFTCLGCETVYYSSNGVNSHLNKTKCGFGDKFRSSPKTCYLQLYRREGDQWFCLGCGIIYGSNRGVHSHLKNTRCGFGEKENGTPKRNYQAMYRREDGVFTCNKCDYKVEYMGGIHKHIKKCVAGFLEESNTMRNVIKNEMPSQAFLESVGEISKYAGFKDDLQQLEVDEAKKNDSTGEANRAQHVDYMDVPLE